MDGAAFAVVSPYNVMNSDQQTQDRILQLIEDEYRVSLTIKIIYISQITRF